MREKFKKHSIKIQFSVAWGFILSLFLAVGLLYFWLFDESYPTKVFNAKAIKETIHSGEPLIIAWQIQKTRQCEGRIVQQIIDSHNAIWHIYTDNDHSSIDVTDEPIKINKAYILPKGIPTGASRYKSVIIWQCNPLKSLRQEIADIPFNIID